jgi:hypothetical protein
MLLSQTNIGKWHDKPIFIPQTRLPHDGRGTLATLPSSILGQAPEMLSRYSEVLVGQRSTPGRVRDFFLHYRVLTGSGAHPPSYPILQRCILFVVLK